MSSSVKVNNSLCATFLKVLGEVGSEDVAKIGRALGQLHSTTEGQIIGPAILVEQDVGYLVEIKFHINGKKSAYH